MQLLAGLGPLGAPELLIILVIVVLVFGVGRLGDGGGALGKGIKEFRNATKDDDAASATPSAATASSGTMPVTTMPADSTTSGSTPAAASADQLPAQSPAASADSIFCSECGARNIRGAKFCAECGRSISAGVGS